MARIKINWTLIIVLLIAATVLAGMAWGLRQWNIGRRSSAGLTEGNKAFEEGNWDQAAANLGKYLSIVQDDAEIMIKYAEAQLRRVPLKRENISQAINAYRRILRLDNTYQIDELRKDAAVKLIGLYLQMNILGEAQLIAERQLKVTDDDDIRRMLAIVYIRQRSFRAASDLLNTIIKDDPSQIPAYDILGRLTEERPQDFSVKSGYWYDKAVADNPDSAMAYVIRASYRLRNNLTKDALADLDKANTLDLSDIAVRLALAQRYIDADKPDLAQPLIDSVYKTDPGNVTLWTTWSNLAMRTNDKQQLSDVAANGIKELGSNAAVFMPIAAEMYIRSDDFPRASECIDKLNQQGVNPATVSFLKGLLAEKQQNWAQTAEYMKQAILQGRQDSTVYLKAAWAFVRLGDTQSAIHQLRALLNKDDTSIAGRLMLADLLFQTGKFDQAADNAQTVLRRQPDNSDARIILAKSRMQLLATGRTRVDPQTWTDIQTDLSKLSADGNAPIEAKLLLVQTAVRRSQFAQAQQVIDSLKQQYPQDVRPRLAEVDILLAGDQTAPAVEKLKTIVTAFPTSTMPITYLVTILARDQKLTECQTIVTEALTRIDKPADVQLLTILLADVYALDKQTEQASTLLLAACQKMPDDIPLMRRLLRAMYAAKDTANLQQFVDRIKTVEGPDGWQWRYEQAKLWYAGDNFADYFIKAAALLKDNLASNPEDQLSRLLLAKWYERTDRLDMAISVYRQAMDQSPGDLNILVPAMTAMYRAERYSQVQEVLAGIPQENLDDPRISRLLLQKHLREGELSSAGDILQRLLTSDPENENDQLALALVKMRQDQDQQARDILNKMTDKNPDFVPAAALLVELELKQNNNTKAIQICDDLINRLDNQSAYRLRSKTRAAIGDVALAEQDMKKAVDLEPDRVRRFIMESEFYRSIGRFDTAATTIVAAVKELPEDFQLKKQAVLTLLDSPDTAQIKQGRQMLDEALAMQPDDIDLRLRKARLLLDFRTAPSTEEAVAILTAINDKTPPAEAAWAILADMYLAQRDSARAMETALKGLTHIPASRALMLAKARAEALNSPMLAIPSLRLLLERYPRDNDIAVYLANTYSAADEYAKALKVLDDRLPDASAQDKQKLSLAKAAILYDSGKTAQAQQQFEQLHDELPDDPGLLLVHSGVLAKHHVWPDLEKMTVDWFRRNPDKPRLLVIIVENLMTDATDGAKQTAMDILDGMIAVKPDCIDALNSLAVINHGQNNIDAAAALYEKVLKLDPDRLVAINNLAWIKCEYQGNPAEAYELVKRGLALNPDYVDLVDTSGMINYRLKQYDKAVEDFRRCIRLYPKNAGALAPTHLHLAKALLGLNKTSEALTNLRLCLNANRDNGGLSPADYEEAGSLITKLEGRN